MISIYNGKYFFRKYINLWSIGDVTGNYIWTKKKAKYKSKLKLKIKIKILAQKKHKQKQKNAIITYKNLYKRFLHIIVPKRSLKLIKNNYKIR